VICRLPARSSQLLPRFVESARLKSSLVAQPLVVAVGVGVAVGAAGVLVGVGVAVGVGVLVGVGVAVGVAVGPTGVLVGVGVAVGMAVTVGVAVGVAVGVLRFCTVKLSNRWLPTPARSDHRTGQKDSLKNAIVLNLPVQPRRPNSLPDHPAAKTSSQQWLLTTLALSTI
jgi:hypothetical protein